MLFVYGLLAGAIATSLAEYKLNYNLVDKVLDLFRSAESKLARARQRAQAASDAVRKAL